MSVELISYRDAALQATGLAALVAGTLRAAIEARGQATLALPGGTTPAPFLRALSGADLDWAHIRVMPTDERLVAADSPRSNARLLRETLLQGPAAAATLIPLAAPAPEGALDDPAGAVRAVLPLDVCVLGMGADMHIASLFPGADRLKDALDPDCPSPILPIRAPAAPEPRITLTAPALLGAAHLHLLIRGRAKLRAFQRAERPGPVAEAPIRLILRAPQGVRVHYADEATP
ncbi:MAG: 6-phosphogluconolactonase [Paracoccaceae bacterium]|nr:6-phosphogluconolactonase [Paracoccaceae bacterium]